MDAESKWEELKIEMTPKMFNACMAWERRWFALKGWLWKINRKDYDDRPGCDEIIEKMDSLEEDYDAWKANFDAGMEKFRREVK